MTFKSDRSIFVKRLLYLARSSYRRQHRGGAQREKNSLKVGTFPFAPNGRAKAMEATGGWVKILADAQTDRLLGAHMIGPWVSDLITEVVSVIEFGGSAEDIARTCHAHPTLSEVVKEAALGVGQKQIHL